MGRLTFCLWVAQAIVGLVALPVSSRPYGPSVGSSAASPSSPSARPNPTVQECADVSKEMHPSCWDTLDMDEWMLNWNKTTKACQRDEIWSSCFLRLAFGETGVDCSMLGSLNCTAPELGQTPKEAHAFYGAYNIWAVEQYFSLWEEAIYSIKSRPAISNLVSILDVGGLPPLTVSSLLVDIVHDFGLDQALDETFISLLPSGKKAKSLDTSQTYMSTQLVQLLSDTLLSLMMDFNDGFFLLLAQHGQLMQSTNETLLLVEDSLAGVLPHSEQAVSA